MTRQLNARRSTYAGHRGVPSIVLLLAALLISPWSVSPAGAQQAIVGITVAVAGIIKIKQVSTNSYPHKPSRNAPYGDWTKETADFAIEVHDFPEDMSASPYTVTNGTIDTEWQKHPKTSCSVNNRRSDQFIPSVIQRFETTPVIDPYAAPSNLSNSAPKTGQPYPIYGIYLGNDFVIPCDTQPEAWASLLGHPWRLDILKLLLNLNLPIEQPGTRFTGSRNWYQCFRVPNTRSGMCQDVHVEWDLVSKRIIEGRKLTVDGAKQVLLAAKSALDHYEEGDEDSREFPKWILNRYFASDDAQTRALLWSRIVRALDVLPSLTIKNAMPGKNVSPTVGAWIFPSMPIMYVTLLYDKLWMEDKVLVLIHELSHLRTVAETEDLAYGEKNCLKLAKDSPTFAKMNADSFALFVMSFQPYLLDVKIP